MRSPLPCQSQGQLARLGYESPHQTPRTNANKNPIRRQHQYMVSDPTQTHLHYYSVCARIHVFSLAFVTAKLLSRCIIRRALINLKHAAVPFLALSLLVLQSIEVYRTKVNILYPRCKFNIYYILRSTNQLYLTVPKTNTSNGVHAFSVSAPTLWNSLPLHIRATASLDIFKSLLKTHLFKISYD